MRTKNQQLWIDALKSGEYDQTRGRLRNQIGNPYEEPVFGYCCLGVCTMVIPEMTPYQYSGKVYEVDGSTTSLTTRMAELVGISVVGGFLPHLINMNDSRNRSFKFIARFLEIVWPGEYHE